MSKLESWFRISLGFLWVCALAVVLIPVCVVMLPWRAARIRMCNVYGKAVGSVSTWLTGARVSFRNREGLDGTFPAIYVSNHASMLDVLLAMWLCPVGGCGVAKKEVARVPLFGWLYKLSGHLLIDRSNRDNAIAGLAGVVEVVRRHRLGVWLWPEGTRSRSGRLLPFKKGMGHIAIATRLPVVPVVVHNAHLNWAKHEMRLAPVDVLVEVLPPIDTSGWTLETLDEHIAAVHAVFQGALGPDQRPLPEPGEGGA